MSAHARNNRALRGRILREIQELFPSNVRTVSSREEQKEVVEVDGRFKVSVLVCGRRNRRGIRGQFPWLLRLLPRDRQNIALICTLDAQTTSIVATSRFAAPMLKDELRISAAQLGILVIPIEVVYATFPKLGMERALLGPPDEIPGLGPDRAA
jgi:hypothetical protein